MLTSRWISRTPFLVSFVLIVSLVIPSLLLVSGCETATEPGDTEPDTIPPPSANGPPAGTVYAVDVSHWSGVVSEGQAVCWWEAGIRHVIAGTQDSATSAQQLAAAASVGLTVDAYVMLEWDQDIGALVERAKRIIGPYPVRRLWLDAERPTDGRTPAEMVGLIQIAVDACGTVPCGIYTGKGWWLASTDNSTAFSHICRSGILAGTVMRISRIGTIPWPGTRARSEVGEIPPASNMRRAKRPPSFAA